MTYDNRNTGILSRNERREKDTHPEYTGKLNIDGVDYWLSGWVKERKDGSGRFFSLSVKPVEPRAKPAGDSARTMPRHVQSRPLREELDDEIPF